MKKTIPFKKQRELGEIISDTFAFVRNEYKPLTILVLKQCGAFLLLFLAAIGAYIYAFGDIFNFSNTPNVSNSNVIILIITILSVVVFGILANVYAESTVLHYIKSYIKNDGKANQQEINNNIKKTFWGFLGLSLLRVLTLVLAALLCVFPIFYFMVPMFIVLAIYVFKNSTAMEAYSESYTLIKNEFWITLFTIFLIGLIVYFIGFAFGIPGAIYSIIKMGIFSGELDPETISEIYRDPIYILLNIVNYLVRFMFQLMVTITAAFVYFNLNEKIYHTGTLERIKEIGKTE